MRIKKITETAPTQASVVGTYNNSQTDSYSCKYVNDLTTWKELALNQNTQTNISLANIDFNELYVIAKHPTDASGRITQHILKNELSTTEIQFRAGYYFVGAVNGGAHIKATNTYVVVQDMYYNGSSITLSAKVDVYYR